MDMLVGNRDQMIIAEFLAIGQNMTFIAEILWKLLRSIFIRESRVDWSLNLLNSGCNFKDVKQKFWTIKTAISNAIIAKNGSL